MLVAALLFLLWKGRGNTFFYDEWTWIETRRSGADSVLQSYNQHLEIVPLAVYQLLFHTVGIGHYRVYRGIAAVAHLACVTAVFVYCRRRVGIAALLVAIPLAVFGPGWEFILWGVNFGFTASLALGILALVVLDGDAQTGSRSRDALACVLLVAGLMFSESALLIDLGLIVELTWRDRGLRRSWIWAVPLLLYAAWWLAFYSSYMSEHDLSIVPKYLVELAASAAGGLFGLGLHGGWVVLAGVMLLLAWRIMRHRALTPRFCGLATALLLFWLLVAFGRAQLGQPWASRYVYTGAVLLVLLVVESLRSARRQSPLLFVAVVLMVVAIFGNVRAFNGGENLLLIGSRTEAAELGALQLAQPFAPASMVLDPHYAPQIIVGSYFAAVHDLGSTPADSPRQLVRRPESMRAAADDVLVRAGEIQIRPSLAKPPIVDPCLDRGHEFVLPAAGLTLRSAGEKAQIRVRRFASGYDNGPAVTLLGDHAVFMAAAADASAVRWHVRATCAHAQP